MFAFGSMDTIRSSRTSGPPAVGRDRDHELDEGMMLWTSGGGLAGAVLPSGRAGVGPVQGQPELKTVRSPYPSADGGGRGAGGGCGAEPRRRPGAMNGPTTGQRPVHRTRPVLRRPHVEATARAGASCVVRAGRDDRTACSTRARSHPADRPGAVVDGVARPRTGAPHLVRAGLRPRRGLQKEYAAPPAMPAHGRVRTDWDPVRTDYRRRLTAMTAPRPDPDGDGAPHPELVAILR